jgi:hypothetical protein
MENENNKTTVAASRVYKAQKLLGWVGTQGGQIFGRCLQDLSLLGEISQEAVTSWPQGKESSRSHKKKIRQSGLEQQRLGELPQTPFKTTECVP